MYKKDRDKVLREIFEYHSREGNPGHPLGGDPSVSNEKSDAFIKFWQKSYNHYNIIILLGSVPNNKEGISFEEICRQYPSRFAGRTTIVSILKEGFDNGFFTKNESTKDQRRQNYKLNHEQKKNLLTWLDNHPIVQHNNK